jgi:predicted amidophosphoribosyltransferase
MPDETKVAKKVHTAGDDHGHYGSASCQACGAGVDGDAEKCPKCGAAFTESVFEAYPFGGSDFP